MVPRGGISVFWCDMIYFSCKYINSACKISHNLIVGWQSAMEFTESTYDPKRINSFDFNDVCPFL